MLSKLKLGSYQIREYQENLRTSQNCSLVSSFPSKIKNFVNASKKLLKNRTWTLSGSFRLDFFDTFGNSKTFNPVLI